MNSLLQTTTTEGTGTQAPISPQRLDDDSGEEIAGCATPETAGAAAREKTVIFLNQARKIIAAHPSCTAFFGWEPEELVGCDFTVLLEAAWHDEIAGVLTREEGAAEGANETVLEIVALRKEGTGFTTHLGVKWLPENRWFCWTVSLQDPRLICFQAGTAEVEDEDIQTEEPPASRAAWRNGRLFSKPGGGSQVSAENLPSQENPVQDERLIEIENSLEKLLEANADLERRLADQTERHESTVKLSSELADQLNLTRASLESAEKARDEKEAQRHELEMELTGLRELRDDLQGKLRAAQEATAEAEGQIEERKQLQEELAGLRQIRDELQDKLTVAEQAASEALDQAEVRNRQLQEESGELRQCRDDLQGKLTVAQKATAEAQNLAEERNRQLQEDLAELRQRRDELQGKLAVAERAAAEAEDKAEERNKQLQEELTGLRQIRDELQGKVTAGHEAVAEAQYQTEELKEQLIQRAADLERVTAELDRQSPERERLEAERRTLAETNEALSAELNALREGEAARQMELTETQREIRAGADSLARVTAELEKQREERQQIERQSGCLAAQLEDAGRELNARREAEEIIQQRAAALEEQLKERDETLARVTADLQNETAVRQMAEQQLRSVVALSAELRKNRASLEGAKTAFQRAQEEFESHIQAGLNLLAETPSPSRREPAGCPEFAESPRPDDSIALRQ